MRAIRSVMANVAALALAAAGGIASEHHRGTTRRIFPRITRGPDDTDRADPANLKGADRQAALEAQEKRTRRAMKARRDYGRSLVHYAGFAQRAGVGRPAWAERVLDQLRSDDGGA